ncbi:MAG: DUF2851 family protein [Bacteroidia bacterium]|nr:DUF2851 family protein [Bacteroidia bacterium]
MESLLHYIWQNRLFYPTGIVSTSGDNIEVINPGIYNRDAGPDFLCAVISINGIHWAGNVEIHINGDDWYVHNHHKDINYSNVVLHVVDEPSKSKTIDINSREIPEIVLRYPKDIANNYNILSTSPINIRCRDIIPELTALERNSWLDRLLIERMEERTDLVRCVNVECDGDWEQTLFVMLARALGQGVNADGIQDVARRSPLKIMEKLSSITQIEALLFGRAGLLDIECDDAYIQRLRREYEILRVRFELPEYATRVALKKLRLRPMSFPTIRISQLAAIALRARGNMSATFSTLDIKALSKALDVKASEYWDEHYDFGVNSGKITEKRIGASSKTLMLINGIIPWLYARAHKMGNMREKENILKMLEFIKPEKNHLIAAWQEVGITPSNEAEACALIHLSKRYCKRRRCLSCRFGQRMLCSGGARI